MKKYSIVNLFVFGLLMTSMCFAENKPLKLVGEANMKLLFWSVYDSRLYTETGRYDETQRPIKLEIEYLRNIKAKDLLERTAVEWNHLGIDKKIYQQWIDALTLIWPDIKKQDVLAIHLDKNNKSTFTFNNEFLGQLDNEAFGKNFLSIWLSPDTSQPEHRLALIGEKQ